MINLRQISWYLDQDMDKGRLEYRPVVATTQLQYYYVSDVNLAAEQSVFIYMFLVYVRTLFLIICFTDSSDRSCYTIVSYVTRARQFIISVILVLNYISVK